MSGELSGTHAQKARNVLVKPNTYVEAYKPAAMDGVVVNPTTAPEHNFHHLEEPAVHPAPHQGYRYASIALTAIAGLVSIASIITAAFSFYVLNVVPSQEEGDSITAALIVVFQALTIAESALCMIAMATCFGLLFTRPHAVLIRNPHNGSFVCLCVSVFLLFIFSAYSFGMILGFASTDDRSPPRAMSVAPAVRLVALISFFAVLVANSKVLPHDRLL